MTTLSTKKLKKCFSKFADATRGFLHAAVLISPMLAARVSAAPSDWLAVDLNAAEIISVERDFGSMTLRAHAQDLFNDDVSISTTVTQSVRSIMDPASAGSSSAFANGLLAARPLQASEWIASLAEEREDVVSSEPVFFECELKTLDSKFSCNDTLRSSVPANTSSFASPNYLYGPNLLAQISHKISRSGSEPSEQSVPLNDSRHSLVTLIPSVEGLVSVRDGKIFFDREKTIKNIVRDDRLAGISLSMFVRDPAIVEWDEKNSTLTAKKSGKTELFVVAPGRISIIEMEIGIESPSAQGPLPKVPVVVNARHNVPTKESQVPAALVSLDGLDRAASRASVSAGFGNDVSTPTDLALAEDFSKLGRDALSGGAQFVRAKAKASFDSIRLKVVDERSTLAGVHYPLSGIRLKIAGTEYNEVTNAQGEVDVRDLPLGARILVELSDSRGYLMPQVSEVVPDRDGLSRGLPQLIYARRFSSLDFIARSGGVVQDMVKSSFCGVVSRGSGELADVSVALDVMAIGPFYFNQLGLVDLRRSATGANGRFCFFNAEPGPVTVAFTARGDQRQLAGVVGLIGGRHTEEAFDLSQAKFLSTTLTTIATANEQLGSDVTRANLNTIVEQADIYAVGTGQLMVPVDSGLMTTATKVLPVKGRVLAVSASSGDFEISVQPINVRDPISRQITTLIPNGFISDMSVLAQTIHNIDEGSVIVEHGNLSGHGNDGIKMRLVDSFGRDVGDGWYFADQPVSKAIFFNVPPGMYGLVIETASGYWIAAETVFVYSESVSVVKTGSQLEKQTHTVSRPLAQ